MVTTKSLKNMSSDHSILENAIKWLDEGRAIALATVVQTWGSAPQPVGSQLLIDSKGEFLGSVSGGCVEGAVITEAIEVIETGKSELMEFGVADETAWQVGLACGGTIRVFVESIDEGKADSLKQIVKCRKERVALAQITDLQSGAQWLVRLDDLEGDEFAGQLVDGFRFDRSGVTEAHGGSGEVFIHIFNPALQLVIVGAVHIAQAVVPIALLAGYDVTVIDPRGSFASTARFEGVNLIAEWPDEVLGDYELDERTAFIALTHDPKIDDPALRIALAGKCFYIGALGSRKTHRGRLERLKGVAGLERIDGPIGLDIGGRGAAEIAIAIMAKMTSALRQGDKV